MTIREKLIDVLQNRRGHVCAEDIIDAILNTADVTFREVQEASALRNKAFPSDLQNWTLLEWAGALAGEAGELANFAKKVRRDGADHTADIGKECADVVIYAMVICNKLGLDLGIEVARKFNEVSDRRDQINEGTDKQKAPRIRSVQEE